MADLEERNENEYLVHRFGAVESLRKNWGWFLVFGAALIFLGCIAVGAAGYTTVFSMKFLGFILAIGGIIEIVHSFWTRQWSGFFLDLLVGILYLVVGVLILTNPAVTAITLTLLMAVLFIVTGTFRAISALFVRFSNWGWSFLSGIVSLILGILILAGWPITGLWVIGLFIGIDLIFYGWSWVIISLFSRRLIR